MFPNSGAGMVPGKLAEILVAAGKITEEQLLEALARQRVLKERGESRPIGEVLLSLGFISDTDLARALARRLNLPFVELREERIDAAAVELVGQGLMRKHAMVPLRVENERLVVAMRSPNDAYARADLGLEAGFPLDIVVSSDEDIRRTQDEIFSGAKTVEPAPDEEVPDVVAEEDPSPEKAEIPDGAEGPTLILRQGMHSREVRLDPGVAGLISEEALREHSAMPVRLEDGLLLVAVSDLSDPLAIRALMSASGGHFLSFVEALKREIHDAHNDLLLPGATPEAPAEEQPPKSPGENSRNGPVDRPVSS